MSDIIRYPWEPPPPAVPERTTEETLAALQRDVASIVAYTAVLVHSSRPEFRMLVNTQRGQIIPRNEATLPDGTTIEFQDIGMPQPGAPYMTVQELVDRTASLIRELGLEAGL